MRPLAGCFLHISMNLTPLPWYGVGLLYGFIWAPVLLVALVVLITVLLIRKEKKKQKQRGGSPGSRQGRGPG